MLKKKRPDGIPQIIYRSLKADIKNRVFKIGEALPGDRVLAESRNWGRSSVISALKLLEAEGLLYRMPGKGTFVAPDFEHRLKMTRIALCREMPSVINPDTVGMTMDLYWGAIAEAERNCAFFSILHFAASNDELEIQRQYEQAIQFDGIIFIGHQHVMLQKKLNEINFPMVIIPSDFIISDNENPQVFPDVENGLSEIAKHVVESGYQRVKIVLQHSLASQINDKHSNYKVNFLRMELIDRGLKKIPETTMINKTAWFDPEVLKTEIGKIITPEYCQSTDVLIVLYTFTLPFIYARLYELGLKVGVDIDLIGICDEITTMNLYPLPSIYKLDFHKLGEVAVKTLIDHCKKIEIPHLTPVKGELMIKDSSR